MAILRTVLSVALLLGIAGCSTPPPPSAAEQFVTEARRAVGPPWSDTELITLGSIACSAPGTVYDKSVSLKAQRAALDYRQAQVIATSATTHICPS